MQMIRIPVQTHITSDCGSTSKHYLRLGNFDDLQKQLSYFDQVTEFDRGRIVAYRDCGLSFREIDSCVERNQTTVMQLCDRWMQEGTTDRRVRSHPPQCTSPWHKVVFPQDVHCFIYPLTQNHRRLRRQWSDERRMWTAEWNEIVFTDESSLETPWREDAEQLRYAPPHWSCTGYYGMGRYWISLSHSSSPLHGLPSRLVARVNGRSDIEMAGALAEALCGPAAEILETIPMEKNLVSGALFDSIGGRYGSQNYQQFQKVHFRNKTHDKGYQGLISRFVGDSDFITQQNFLEALRDHGMQQYVRLSPCSTLQEAPVIAMKCEASQQVQRDPLRFARQTEGSESYPSKSFFQSRRILKFVRNKARCIPEMYPRRTSETEFPPNYTKDGNLHYCNQGQRSPKNRSPNQISILAYAHSDNDYGFSYREMFKEPFSA
ncbi:hypothetical protein LAZ67_2005851 [Cordylochernes scorpioides]|uniref:Uncharacterized protein n=1 Tax=Cordylochernes scorpioides TaxID=51811 RepID=A0ABY6K6D0_9ARAC|nr:hypothetical protein LAZ67_2005851 [Cordylochernes scorpioides]